MNTEWTKQTERQLVIKRFTYFLISGAISALLLTIAEFIRNPLVAPLAFIFPGLLFAVALSKIRLKRKAAYIPGFVAIFTVLFTLFNIGFVFVLIYKSSDYFISQGGLSLKDYLVFVLIMLLLGGFAGLFAAGSYGHFLKWDYPKAWKTALVGSLAYTVPFLLITASQHIISWPYLAIQTSILILVWQLAVGWLFCLPTEDDRKLEVRQMRGLISRIGKE
ncbi:MAG: hypothetical protein AB8F95_18350 [Bacteroidia bacterium]